MSNEPPSSRASRSRGRRALNAAFLAIGLLTLGLLVRHTGVHQLANQMLRVGNLFWVILLTELLSNAASCRGWYHAFRIDDRPRYARLLVTGLASLTVAGALPSGQAGELAKANLLRGYVKPTSIVSSLLVFNYLHMLTTCCVVVVCAIAGLARFEWRVTTTVAVTGFVLAIVTACGGRLLRSRALARVSSFAARSRFAWLRPPCQLAALRDRC